MAVNFIENKRQLGVAHCASFGTLEFENIYIYIYSLKLEKEKTLHNILKIQALFFAAKLLISRDK